MHSATVFPRVPGTFSPRGAGAFLALAVACLVLAACSPGADYPSLFPSVHDLPPPRTDTTLDSNQVQQATEDLISARDRLSAGAQDKSGARTEAKTQAKTEAKTEGTEAKTQAKTGANSSAKPAAGSAAARKPPSIPVSDRQTLGTDADQTAGTETK